MTEPSRRSWRGRCLRAGAAIAAAGLGLGVCLALWEADSVPEASPGPEAEALADALEAASGLEGWRKLGAIRWGFAGRRDHLWDRRRGLVRVRAGERVTLVDLASQTGRAWDGEQELAGAAAEEAVAAAYAAWVNDSFWLNPLAKLRDPGVELAATADGRLLVSYGSGGLTPGDRYLWQPGPGGLPVGWKMWTSNLPLPGVDASWEDWQELPGGVWIARRHRMFGVLSLELSDVAGAASVSELEPGPDPFAPLVKGR